MHDFVKENAVFFFVAFVDVKTLVSIRSMLLAIIFVELDLFDILPHEYFRSKHLSQIHS